MKIRIGLLHLFSHYPCAIRRFLCKQGHWKLGRSALITAVSWKKKKEVLKI
jgi:hypothetical protein